jgi:predicted transposase/invertase (TIGR01784 family)
MGLGIDPKVDVAFKKVFGSEDNTLLLIDLLHAVILPDRRITGLEIAQAQSEKDLPLDKQAIGDIRARDQGNRRFHLEMQWQTPWFFPKRFLFYWSKFHSQQMRAGDYYQTLGPTFSICFANSTLFPAVADHHLVFRLLEAKRPVEQWRC